MSYYYQMEFNRKYPLIERFMIIWIIGFVISMGLFVLFLSKADEMPIQAEVLAWVALLGIAVVCFGGFWVKLIPRMLVRRNLVAYGNNVAFVNDGCTKYLQSMKYMCSVLAQRNLLEEVYGQLRNAIDSCFSRPELVLVFFKPLGTISFMNLRSSEVKRAAGLQIGYKAYVSWGADYDRVMSLLGHELAHVVLYACRYKGDHHRVFKAVGMDSAYKDLGWDQLG